MASWLAVRWRRWRLSAVTTSSGLAWNSVVAGHSIARFSQPATRTTSAGTGFRASWWMRPPASPELDQPRSARRSRRGEPKWDSGRFSFCNFILHPLYFILLLVPLQLVAILPPSRMGGCPAHRSGGRVPAGIRGRVPGRLSRRFPQPRPLHPAAGSRSPAFSLPARDRLRHRQTHRLHGADCHGPPHRHVPGHGPVQPPRLAGAERPHPVVLPKAPRPAGTGRHRRRRPHLQRPVQVAHGIRGLRPAADTTPRPGAGRAASGTRSERCIPCPAR